jgi:hypothetical protein
MRSFLKPLAYQVDLLLTKPSAGFGWGHSRVIVLGRDTLEQFTFHGPNDGMFLCISLHIETQIPLSFARIGTMALETVFSKNRANLPIEFHSVGATFTCRRHEQTNGYAKCDGLFSNLN